MIGTDPGILASDNGGTHMCFEDVALIRAIPGSIIVDVTDAAMFHYMLKETKDCEGIVYFRTGRRNMPDVYQEGTTFQVGKGKVLSQGTDVTVIASGIMVGTALEAKQILAGENISVRVVDPVTIKPLDEKLIVGCAVETGAIVVSENHNIYGGLGSAVAEIISENFPVPVIRHAIEDRFGQTGSVPFLRNEYKLTTDELIKKVRYAIEMKEKRNGKN